MTCQAPRLGKRQAWAQPSSLSVCQKSSPKTLCRVISCLALLKAKGVCFSACWSLLYFDNSFLCLYSFIFSLCKVELFSLLYVLEGVYYEKFCGGKKKQPSKTFITVTPFRNQHAHKSTHRLPDLVPTTYASGELFFQHQKRVCTIL